MSRTDEVHRITENVYKSIMEQFNPCLRNFIAMGKSYEKALTSVTHAAKGYFDALVRMGEMASQSQGAKDLEETAWEVLFQMAEVHRRIQIQLEEMLKSFHNELLTELEKKVEMDARYLNAALKKYQMEHKSKGESLEKCQAELKKLRRKSQSSKTPAKYGEKEMQYVEAVNAKQSELDSYIAEGYRNALSEERRRFCFLVDRQVAAAKTSGGFHGKGEGLPVWQQDPSKLPERFLTPQMSAMAEPGVKSLPVPPELAALRISGAVGPQRLMEGGAVALNGTAGAGDYQQWAESKASLGKTSPQGQRHGGDVYSNTLPVRKAAPAKSKASLTETRTLPRSSSMAAGMERNGRMRVQAVFSHAAGDNGTLLSFNEGDVVTLLVPEARDGWHYGENEKTRMRGWFPFSYTRVIGDGEGDAVRLPGHRLQHGKSSSTGNLLEAEGAAQPAPDYVVHPGVPTHSAALQARQPRPYAVMPGFSQAAVEDFDAARFTGTSSSDVKLISTV
ncbi:brain-specific angiogenesis inhibitor 1-associated protein 2 isoform X1 [Dunckerocampus dactyliophorus]|uniref:brain-specific angiogenesis inhibitor 1-associated protein 2 isoform X1 n=1 Tax=Dunckerocampus dactyliophorus TaxID=161453 RepID=UPI002404C218|nr:brain-specific angiogenesis inhibitor 1-associated protein 2 isoform X1 [Dunckerocampus dactyliophorus]